MFGNLAADHLLHIFNIVESHHFVPHELLLSCAHVRTTEAETANIFVDSEGILVNVSGAIQGTYVTYQNLEHRLIEGNLST
jgi:hypothetical protein